MDFECLDALVGVAMRLEMDMTSRVENLEEIVIINPLDMKKSYIKCCATTNLFDFYNTEVYPEKVMNNAIEFMQLTGSIMPPKCIFLPSQSCCRLMCRVILEHGEDQMDVFLLRFGILENQNWYLKQDI